MLTDRDLAKALLKEKAGELVTAIPSD